MSGGRGTQPGTAGGSASLPGADLHRAGYQPDGTRAGLTVLVGIGLAAVLILAGFWVHWLIGEYTRGRPGAPRSGYPAEVEHSPVQNWTAPVEELSRYREQQRALLQSYAWVDREAGVARIPIERAMELLSRPQPEDGPAGRTRAGGGP